MGGRNTFLYFITASQVLLSGPTAAFQGVFLPTHLNPSQCVLSMSSTPAQNDDRRSFLLRTSAFLLGGGGMLTGAAQPASAVVYLDPAMYGDQENRVAAVDSLREAVRRAILENPKLATSFYNLAIMDGLSFDVNSKAGGPDGRIVRQVLESKANDPFVADLKESCLTLISAKENLKRKTAITLADAVAIGGAEAIESIGGPVLSVQLGRTDAPKSSQLSPLPVDLLSGSNPDQVVTAFRRSGLTEREMTALLGALLTLGEVTKDMAPTGDWQKSKRGQFREPGKIGRMSDFKRLTEEDIAEMEDSELSDDEDWYIADTFGTREQAFGSKIGGAKIDAKNFNVYLKDLGKGGSSQSWIGTVLTDDIKYPTAKAMLAKYATSPLIYNKDLAIAFNAITQLGAEFTGGKYESLLKDKPRKSLNDLS